MIKMRVVHLILYALASYATEFIAISDKEKLTCNSEKCECRGTDLSRISCFFIDESFFLPRGISTHLRSVTIEGKNFSLYIPDQKYDDSWSLLESFEVNGDGVDTNELHLPYNFTRELSQVKLFRMRNTGLISIEEKSFRNMTVLEHLDLSQNKFLNIRYLELAMVQSSFAKLNKVNISRIHSGEKMSLYNIIPRFIHQISAIKHLDISSTRTTTIQQIELLSNLKTLNMSRTPILFNDKTCLKTVLLLDNLAVWRMDHWPSLVTKIYVRHRRWGFKNLVFPIGGSVFSCSAVNSFRNGCYILPPELKELYINEAEASEFFIDFEEDVCIRSKLEHLSIRNLKVTGPVGIIRGLHDLKSFDISHTGFPFKSRLFHDMEALESVEASGNRLFLKENEIGFAELFVHNKNLKRVDLSENGISTVSYNLFYQNSFLQSIDLSSNNLQYLNLNLTASQSLQHLFLSNNGFKYLGGEGAIVLEVMPTHHNVLTISGISEDTGLTCKCSDYKRKHSTKVSTVPLIEDSCTDMRVNTSDIINETSVSLIRCSRAVLENITSFEFVDEQNTNSLIFGISIPLLALGALPL